MKGFSFSRSPSISVKRKVYPLAIPLALLSSLGAFLPHASSALALSPEMEIFLSTGCSGYQECMDKGYGNAKEGRWVWASTFFKKAERYARLSQEIDKIRSAAAYLTISDVNLIWELYRKYKKDGSANAEEFLRGAKEGDLGDIDRACPIHDACIDIAERLVAVRDYQSALLNYKRALFRKPGSQKAEDGIRLMHLFIIKR